MAKLSARGRTEVARVVVDIPAVGDDPGKVKSFAFMSDGAVLIKTSWKRSTDAESRRHTTGWKVMTRVVAGNMLARANAFAERLRISPAYGKAGVTVTLTGSW